MPAGATYEPIGNGTGATINFTSISGYTDLRAVIVTSDDVRLKLNNDTATNYSMTFLRGNGTTAASTRYTSGSNFEITYNFGASGQPKMISIDLFNYAGSTNKTILATYSGDNNGSGTVERAVGLYRSTSAITSLGFFLGGASTTIALYGIKAA